MHTSIDIFISHSYILRDSKGRCKQCRPRSCKRNKIIYCKYTNRLHCSARLRVSVHKQRASADADKSFTFRQPADNNSQCRAERDERNIQDRLLLVAEHEPVDTICTDRQCVSRHRRLNVADKFCVKTVVNTNIGSDKRRYLCRHVGLCLPEQ